VTCQNLKFNSFSHARSLLLTQAAKMQRKVLQNQEIMGQDLV